MKILTFKGGRDFFGPLNGTSDYRLLRLCPCANFFLHVGSPKWRGGWGKGVYGFVYSSCAVAKGCLYTSIKCNPRFNPLWGRVVSSFDPISGAGVGLTGGGGGRVENNEWILNVSENKNYVLLAVNGKACIVYSVRDTGGLALNSDFFSS